MIFDHLAYTRVSWSCGQNLVMWPKFQHNHGQMVKISTMTMAKIQIFHGQNGRSEILPRNLPTKIPILTMTMAEIQTSYGQNGKPLI